MVEGWFLVVIKLVLLAKIEYYLNPTHPFSLDKKAQIYYHCFGFSCIEILGLTRALSGIYLYT